MTRAKAGGGDKDDVSVDEFCAAAEKFENTFTETDTDRPCRGASQALKDAARELEDVGTPEDIPDDAREGLALTLDKLIALPDDADEDRPPRRLDFDEDEKAKSMAFEDYLDDTCAYRAAATADPDPTAVGARVRGWGADGTDVGRTHEARTARSKPRPRRGRGGRLRRRRQRRRQCQGQWRRRGVASTEDFCGGLPGLRGRPRGLTGDEANLGEILKKAAQRIEDVGTPDDIPDDAKEGLQLTLDAIADLPDDASAEDMGGLEDDFSADDKKKTDAFSDTSRRPARSSATAATGSDDGSGTAERHRQRAQRRQLCG